MKPSDAYLVLDRLTVLIVDDNAPLRGILRTILNAMGAPRIYEAGDVRTAMDVLQHEHVDLLICDWLWCAGFAIRPRALAPRYRS